MRRLLQPLAPGPIATGLLALAAVAVLVADFQHARLFHRGYAEVALVGPLFLMNAIGSTVVVLSLIFRRVWMFVPGPKSDEGSGGEGSSGSGRGRGRGRGGDD